MNNQIATVYVVINVSTLKEVHLLTIHCHYVSCIIIFIEQLLHCVQRCICCSQRRVDFKDVCVVPNVLFPKIYVLFPKIYALLPKIYMCL